MNKHRVAPAMLIAPLLALALTGCWPSGPTEPTMSPSSPPAASSETPAPDPSPTEPPVALATDCRELLDADTLAMMAGGGFPLVDAVGTASYTDKTRGEGNPLALFVDGGGLLCLTSNGYAVAELFGFSPITPESAATQKARLLGDGLIASSYLGGELYSDTSMSDNVVFEYLFVDGYWFCSATVDRLDEVVANSGVPV